MIQFIKDVGGWWEFLKGVGYIIIILVSIPIIIDITRDIRRNRHPLD